MRLARRVVRSGAWASGAGVVVALVLVLRSVILARLLPVEVFGVYAFAAALTTLTAVLARFGMDDALVHRAPATAAAEPAAGVHFALAALFAGGWLALMLGLAWAWAEGATRTAIVVLSVTQLMVLLTATPIALLRRAVEHRLLSAVGVLAAILSTAAGLTLALLGQGLWALLAVDAVAALVSLAALFLLGPGWRPRLRWDPTIARHLLAFGGRNVLGRLLEEAQLRLDKLWTGSVLGAQPLGLYARAFAYSRAPVGLVGRPLDSVPLGAFAELAHDRARLTAAANRMAEILVHGAALVAVTVGVVAPELIVVLIGPKWLPMLDAFRILLCAAVPMALHRLLIQLLVGVGQPALRVRIAAWRLLVLGLSILFLGPRLGIEGVALATLAAAGAGLALSLHHASRFADPDLRTLLLPPVLASLAALLAGWAVGRVLPVDQGPVPRLLAQSAAVAVGYGSALLTLRGRAFREHLRYVVEQLRPSAGRAD